MNILVGTAQTKVSAPRKPNTIFAWLSKHHILATFFFLLVIEVCVFGSLVCQMGIYLDEWTTFNNLHFCQQTFWDLLKCVFFDPRYIIRPVGAPCLAAVYYFYHENALIYHLLNQAYELAGAFFLCLALVVILKDKAISFLAAGLFLIYPSHDITRYSIGASSASAAITFYTLSLWLFVLAVERKRHTEHEVIINEIESADKAISSQIIMDVRRQTKTGLYGLFWLSALSFLLSLLSYEICLPLLIVFIVAATILLLKDHKPLKVLTLAVLYTVPLFIAVGLTILYRMVLLPCLGLGCGYRTVFDISHLINVISAGIKVSILPYAFSFFLDMARAYFSNGINFGHLISLVIAAATLIIAGWALTERGVQSNHLGASKLATALGLLIIICAYAIFGSSPDYLPVLDTHINRVNTASSIGAAMIIVGVLGCLSEYLSKLVNSQQVKSIILPCLVLPVLLLFILANWQFAVPWVTSWQKQKQVINILKHRMGICSGDTIILADCPRYIMWASVFDGVWDFQSALRINLNRTDINGGILSDRMVVTRNAVEDKFKNYLCARYSLKQMFLLIPSPERWISIHSAPEFISWAQHYNTSLSVNKIYKMPVMKPFSFKCLTVKKHFNAMKRRLSRY